MKNEYNREENIVTKPKLYSPIWLLGDSSRTGPLKKTLWRAKKEIF